MFAIYKKELKNYFINMTGYIFIGFMLAVTGIFTTLINLISTYPSFENVLSNITIVFLLIIPILTMRSVAEERHSKTDQLLYSLPVSVTQIVLAKYLAMFTVFLIPVGIIGLYPLILSIFGTVYLGTAYGALLGFTLLGGALIAVGMFMSSLTESQVIAAVTSFGVIFAMYLMSAIASLIPAGAMASLVAFAVVVLIFAGVVYSLTKNSTVAGITAAAGAFILAGIYFINSSIFDGLFANVLNWLSVFDRFSTFTTGLFDLTSVVYYVSLIILFVFGTVQSVEKRRWS
ncbi:MAG: ABC transporter permease [Clostridia bacterium]|nr:ABC transporter permease [Clostridia bacterium]